MIITDEQRADLRTKAEAAAAMLALLDELDRIMECNRAAERVILGCNEEIERLRSVVPLANALDGVRAPAGSLRNLPFARGEVTMASIEELRAEPRSPPTTPCGCCPPC